MFFFKTVSIVSNWLSDALIRCVGKLIPIAFQQKKIRTKNKIFSWRKFGLKNRKFWKIEKSTILKNQKIIIEIFYQRIFEILKGILTFQKNYFSFSQNIFFDHKSFLKNILKSLFILQIDKSARKRKTDPHGAARWAHRQNRFWNTFFPQNMHFLPISQTSTPDLRRSFWSENFLTSIFVFVGAEIP